MESFQFNLPLLDSHKLQKKARNGEKVKPQKETLMKILNYVKNR